MSISVTVSGEDSTSVILSSVLTELVSISGGSSVDVVASSGNSAIITVSSGDPISITGNYSNFVTGQVVRPPEISDFLTENQINTKITTAVNAVNEVIDSDTATNEASIEGVTNEIQDNSDAIADNTSNISDLTGVTGSFITDSETGLFYASSNPSGFITGVDLFSYTTEDFVTGVSGFLQSQISSNYSDITDIINITGSFVLQQETASAISAPETDQFYLTSNPSGFITGVDLSSYVQSSETGVLYPTSNPSGFITGVDLSSYIQDSETGAFYPASNPSGFITGGGGDVDLSSYVQDSETGLFLVSGEDAIVSTILATNVGIGTTSPDELLHLEAAAIAGREVLMKATVSDAGNDQFGISNGTSLSNNFAPSFYGYKDSNYGNGYIYSLNFRGLVPNAQDTTQTNRFGIIHFETFKTNSATDPNNGTFAALTNRKLFTFSNQSKTVLEIDADDTVSIADNANLRWGGYVPTNSGLFNPAIGINVDRDNIAGLDFKNQSTVGQVRFMARNDQDSYIVINQPASNSTASWFGIPAGNGSYVWLSSTNDTDKKLGIGTLNAGDVVIGANNTAAMNIKASTQNVEILNTLDFGSRTSNDTLITAASNNNDISLIRASSSSGAVGVDLKYIGSGDGDENIFEIATDGGGSLKMDNSGDVGINVAPTDGVDLTVGSLKLGSIADVEAEINAKAPTASPTLTGTTTVEKISLTANSFIVETASFTLTSAHCGATVLLQNTGAITITVPQLIAGHTTTFISETINSVTFASGTGLLGFNSFNSANRIAGIFGQAQIIFKSSDYAFLGGNVV